MTAHVSSVLQEPLDHLDLMDRLGIQDPMACLVLLELPVLMDNLDLKDHPETLGLQDLLVMTDNLALLERMALMDVGNPGCPDPLERQVHKETLDLTDSQDRMVLPDLRVLLDNLVLLDCQVAMVAQELLEVLDCLDTMPHIARAHLDRLYSCRDSHTKLAVLFYTLQFIYDKYRSS